ncbi:MAG: D-alanine--D-alanine ligase [Clostridia bacterium]|nr:D-alanine--D-alanine ligase [Clostridia bacterium]
MLKVAVFFGGKTVEHDVSVVTALQLMENLDKTKYDIIPIYITRQGDWFTGKKLMSVKGVQSFDPADSELERCYLPANVRARQLYRYNTKDTLFKKQDRLIASIDVAIPAMHGLNGEDGTLQGLLELAGVPYTSCGVLGSAAGMDKILMKAAFKGAGLPVLPYIFFDRGSIKENMQKHLDDAEATLSYPMFVKPANLGSSIGISKANNREELENAIVVASHYDRRILVEQGVSSLCEINCSALGFGDDVTPSVCEMPVTWEEFLTYDEKYMRGGKSAKGSKGASGMASLSRQIPAPISEDMTKVVEDCTVKAFRLLDCKGVVRIDYIIDKATDTLYINEINTIPGSFAYYLWEPKGITYPELLDKLIDYAIKAHNESKNNEYAYDSEILTRYGQGQGGVKK